MATEKDVPGLCGADFFDDDDDEQLADHFGANEDDAPQVNGFFDDEEEGEEEDDVRAGEEYEYERDEGNDEPQSTKREGSSAASASRFSEDHVKEVKVMFRVSGSMNGFASDSGATMLGISQTAHNRIFGKGKQHIIKGLTLTRVNSTFPVSLLWDIHDVRGIEKEEVFTQTGASGVYVSMPNEKNDAIAIPLIKESSKPDAKFLRVFPGWTLENIDTGVAKLGRGKASVCVDHPVVAVLKRAYEKKGATPDLQEFQGFYFVTEKLLDTGMRILKKDMEAGLPITNLNQLKLSISRAVTSTSDDKVGAHGKEDTGTAQSQWVDTAEIGNNIRMRGFKKGLMDEEYAAYVELKIRYRDA